MYTQQTVRRRLLIALYTSRASCYSEGKNEKSNPHPGECSPVHVMIMVPNVCLQPTCLGGYAGILSASLITHEKFPQSNKAKTINNAI